MTPTYQRVSSAHLPQGEGADVELGIASTKSYGQRGGHEGRMCEDTERDHLVLGPSIEWRQRRNSQERTREQDRNDCCAAEGHLLNKWHVVHARQPQLGVSHAARRSACPPVAPSPLIHVLGRLSHVVSVATRSSWREGQPKGSLGSS